eukprot:11097447-Karenia_brevis.AAC.1
MMVRIAAKTADSALAGSRVDLSALRELIRSKAQSALSEREKILLRCIGANAFWPRSRLHEA